MRKQLPLLLLLLLPFMAMARSTVVVPKNIYFADIHLRISDGAQQEIQKKVDALHRFPTYFNIKVELANAYFPLIERTFKEEGVPDDFKFLALQESGLIGDAVSTSNAVGYWQFKKEAALDFSLRMDHVIDERKHIIEASRGAAKYFKRSNNYYNNWFNTLLSYYMGYTGAKTATAKSDIGSKKMDITEKSHPYLLTYLAHKVAYENFIGKKPAVALREMRATPGQSLTDIALATQTDYAELEKYNKWLLGNAIPSDKDYYVMVPVRSNTQESSLLASTTTPAPPVVKQNPTQPAAGIIKKNGLNALVAREGDTKDKLALQAGISTKRFLNYNDMHSFDNIEKGAAYYIEPKRNSTEQEYHVVQPGETMQTISQHYGIKLSYLLFKNHMARTEVPVPGRVLWLQKRRPARTPVEVRDLKQPQSQPNTPIIAKETGTTATSENSEAEETPKENFFQRLINSLKGKPEPAKQEEVPTSDPAETIVVAKEPVKAIEPEPKKETAPKSEQKVNDGALYPGNKKTTPASQPKTERKEEESAAFPVKATTEVKTVPSSEPEQSEKKQTPASTSTRHIVKEGETLYGISRLYAVSVNDISKWNRLGDEPIKIGQELLIAEPQTLPQSQQPRESIAPAAGKAVFHTVGTGETLYQITKKYDISLEELLSWNNMTSSSIQVGQQLRVVAPEGTSVPAKVTETQPTNSGSGSQGNYHIVQPGESMYQISRKYGVTIKDIMEWNNKNDFNVSIGEKLLVRKQ